MRTQQTKPGHNKPRSSAVDSSVCYSEIAFVVAFLKLYGIVLSNTTVIIYSPSSRSDPILPSFFGETHKKCLSVLLLSIQ